MINLMKQCTVGKSGRQYKGRLSNKKIQIGIKCLSEFLLNDYAKSANNGVDK
ncbi:hypothetical protein HMPREF9370_1089 [Neisseria wadsworthii 9715]|uniref:Uncharacterized protein n=1 Tax=Neisseria wadsworthii 9715 TaxID=1030841 RepID=G4CPS9_9NEIS|nr:hypothetical protein HMPREF9370_1089 [Neisseria wadsworthii 9715]